MKSITKPVLLSLGTSLASTSLWAASEAASQPTGWHADNLPQAILYMLIFAVIGIATAIFGYRLFDKCTPGDLHREIIENKNVAAALIGGAVILGVCIIVAAAMLG